MEKALQKNQNDIIEILIKSSIDNSLQPSLIYRAKSSNRPLLVVLHTWSHDRFNQVENFLPYGKKYDINLIFPEFRGPNITDNPNGTDSCCSPKAIQDIFDAVEYFKQNYKFDKSNLFLTGASGGGLMALMACGQNPTYFKAVQAVVPITDLAKWHQENESYRKNLEYCLGGEPKGELLNEYEKRSPVSYVAQLSTATLRICSGKFDKVVHYSHGLSLYNEITKYNSNSKTYLEIFDGGHEQNVENQFEWILSQIDKKSLLEVTG